MVITSNLPIESASFFPTERAEQARQRRASFHLESLPEHNYVEINIATPTPSMRKGKTNVGEMNVDVRPAFPHAHR